MSREGHAAFILNKWVHSTAANRAVAKMLDLNINKYRQTSLPLKSRERNKASQNGFRTR
jgi:hypothetical protein